MRSHTDPYDRTWHAAFSDGTQLVRYNRTGKYYLEKPEGGRKRILLPSAVQMVVEAYGAAGAAIAFGRAGGMMFDSAVKKALRARTARE
jgi:hypothetical protein